MITFRNLGKLGRFGNQLFQYAGTRLYAELNEFSWAFPLWDGDRIFQLLDHPLPLSARLLPTLQLSDMATTSWSERLLSPLGFWRRGSLARLYERPRDSISLYGYLQDDPAMGKLREHSARVRSWLTFQPEIDSAFRRATDRYRPWLAVHIRRGDLVRRGKTTSLEDTGMHIERLRETRSLFIASDDASIPKQFPDRIASENPLGKLPPYVFDFWMLKEADILIGSGSTFAWWAAFLGQPSEYWSPSLNRTWPKGEAPPIEHRVL